MRSYTCIPRSSDQRFALLEGNVYSSFWIPISFSQSKINNVDNPSFIAFSYHKIIGLNVSMDEAFPMYSLEPIYYLETNLKDSTQAKFLLMSLEYII